MGHRNRTLVLNNQSITNDVKSEDGSPNPTTGDAGQQTTPAGSNGWVAKRDRHMQLINTSVYDKQSEARIKAIELSRQVKADQRDQRQKAKVDRFVQGLAQRGSSAVAGLGGPSSGQTVYEITISDIPFRVVKGGSKLMRSSSEIHSVLAYGDDADLLFTDDPNPAKATPKETMVGGVKFVRSKNGNLYRSGIVKKKRWAAFWEPDFTLES